MQLDIPTIIATLGAIVSVWLLLVAVSHFSYRRAFGTERLYKRYRRGLVYTSFSAATEIAAERREEIEGFIREFRERTSLPLEFLEFPPEIRNIRRREFSENETEGSWLAARLQNELADDRYLLAGRVIDAITCLRRSEQLDEQDTPTSIRLEPLGSGSGVRGLYPWRVIIETTAIDRIRSLLDPLHDWLGIGIDFATPLPIFQYGRCEAPGGSNGVVGGVLTTKMGSYLVTCWHVLGSECGSQIWPPPRSTPVQFTDSVPDAALLHTGGPCSITNVSMSTRAVRCMEDREVRRANQGNSKFIKSTERGRHRSRIDFPEVRYFKIGRHEYVGPHVLITTYFVRRFWVYWPLFARRFSNQGESGTWVLDQQSGAWLGMIVGGYEPPLVGTILLSGHHLLDAVGNSINSGIRPDASVIE